MPKPADTKSITGPHARVQGEYSGSFILTISRVPIVPKLNSGFGRETIASAAQYIRDTVHVDSAPELKLASDVGGRISIAKVSATGSKIGLFWMAGSMWEDDICNELAVLMQQRVTDKMQKLQKKGIETGKAILLLYAAFAVADVQSAMTALRRVCGYDWFHSIFWAAPFADRRNSTYSTQPGREGVFLFSANPEWHFLGTLETTDE